MATALEPDPVRRLQPHRLEMLRLMEDVDSRAGIRDQPALTAEQVQEMMRGQGVRDEDNILSREIIRMRYGEARNAK